VLGHELFHRHKLCKIAISVGHDDIIKDHGGFAVECFIDGKIEPLMLVDDRRVSIGYGDNGTLSVELESEPLKQLERGFRSCDERNRFFSIHHIKRIKVDCVEEDF
jgi:hypothetical protein